MRLDSDSRWIRHGFLNTLEHGFTRVSDALVSLLLLWRVAPEAFSKLVLAQAVVAPLLILFIAPENVMYRDYSVWRQQGASVMASRLRAFRLFAWGKGQLALLISALIAVFGQGEASTRFGAMIWAFSLALAPQIAGPDREFLRLDLKLKALSWLSIYQKSVLLIGSLGVVFFWHSNVLALGGVAAFSAVSTAVFARALTRRELSLQGAEPTFLSGQAGPSVFETLSHSVRTFSFWQHLSGVALNWVQTMDLFFLGIWHFPAREVGLYASALKLANFSVALPSAIANTFQVWVGRRASVDGMGVRKERKLLSKFSLIFALGCVAQSLVLAVLAPWIFSVLSNGRWSLTEQHWMTDRFYWILGGSTLFCASLLVGFWLFARASMREMLMLLYLPWLIVSLATYGVSIQLAGTVGAAYANVAVGAAYVVFLLIFLRRTLHVRTM